MNRWLLKTEPSEYPFDQLMKDRRTVWSGVSNALALTHLRAMRRGDEVLIYHTGGATSVMGLARAASDPYPDPRIGDPRIAVIDVEPVRPLRKPVSLLAIKQHPKLADFPLVRISRLSVMPVDPRQWRTILKLAGEDRAK